MAGQHGLPFPLLSDPGNKVATQFGLTYTVPPQMVDYYRSILVNLSFINGDQSGTLALPATYVIAPSEQVLFAEAHSDFRVRPEPEEVLVAAFSTR
jgi:peroxiredoxin